MIIDDGVTSKEFKTNCDGCEYEDRKWNDSPCYSCLLDMIKTNSIGKSPHYIPKSYGGGTNDQPDGIHYILLIYDSNIQDLQMGRNIYAKLVLHEII